MRVQRMGRSFSLDLGSFRYNVVGGLCATCGLALEDLG